jgi:hypothetical protein
MTNQVTSTMQWIEYKDKSILLIEYSGVDMLDLEGEIHENELATIKLGKSGKTDLLFLTDVTSVHIDLAAVNAFKSATQAMEPYTKGSAVVGIHGIRRILLDAVNRFSKIETKAFDTLDRAKEWLVSL